MITHRLSTARYADRIVVMSKGTVVEQGTHLELMKKQNGAYATMVARQLKGLDNENMADEEKEQPLTSSISTLSKSSHLKSKDVLQDQTEQHSTPVSIKRQKYQELTFKSHIYTMTGILR
jgi:ATP-binding cassette, subfamily B (MDR/TAP), member 1